MEINLWIFKFDIGKIGKWLKDTLKSKLTKYLDALEADKVLLKSDRMIITDYYNKSIELILSYLRLQDEWKSLVGVIPSDLSNAVQGLSEVLYEKEDSFFRGNIEEIRARITEILKKEKCYENIFSRLKTLEKIYDLREDLNRRMTNEKGRSFFIESIRYFEEDIMKLNKYCESKFLNEFIILMKEGVSVILNEILRSNLKFLANTFNEVEKYRPYLMISRKEVERWRKIYGPDRFAREEADILKKFREIRER